LSEIFSLQESKTVILSTVTNSTDAAKDTQFDTFNITEQSIPTYTTFADFQRLVLETGNKKSAHTSEYKYR